MADDTPKPTLAELRTAITQTVERFLDAWNRHDARALSETFAPDADFTNVMGAHVRGRDKIEDAHAKLFSGPLKEVRQTAFVRSIRMLTLETAAVDIDWEMEFPRGAGGQPARIRRGLMNWVLIEVPEGPWMILILHNAEIPGAAR